MEMCTTGDLSLTLSPQRGASPGSLLTLAELARFLPSASVAQVYSVTSLLDSSVLS